VTPKNGMVGSNSTTGVAGVNGFKSGFEAFNLGFLNVNNLTNLKSRD
jgi:hypothetical protein